MTTWLSAGLATLMAGLLALATTACRKAGAARLARGRQRSRRDALEKQPVAVLAAHFQMKRLLLTFVLVAGDWFAARVFVLEGAIGIHDPSTVAVCDGKYYVYGTGRGVSANDLHQPVELERGERVFDRIPESVSKYVPKNTGSGVWAPDIVKMFSVRASAFS